MGEADTSGNAREELIDLLRHACSGELAAAHAYNGHWKSVRDKTERSEIKQIEADELHHRARIIEMLSELGAEPDAKRERKLNRIGRVISMLCRVGGWFIPMYGAGRLEAPNIAEYETAARLARKSGLDEWIEEFLNWAEVEWDHEKYFRDKVNSHFLRHVFPMWKIPPARETIRGSFQKFQDDWNKPSSNQKPTVAEQKETAA
ncbi:MAG: ferritin-like domain-containing protein [Planctomycetota bacterium]|jgi:rubrerythrin